MKISDKFIVSSIAGENVILPIDNDCVDYNSVFMLNETGMFIVSSMPATYDEILNAILREYEVTFEDAKYALDHFLDEVKKYGIIE